MDLEWNGAELQCPNVRCGGVKRVESFIKALEIENVSEKSLRKFDIFTFEDLLDFRSNGSVVQNKFYEDLYSKMFNQSQRTLLRAMKFDGFGTSLFDRLYAHVGNCLIMMNNMFNCEYLIPGVLPEGIGIRTIEKAQEDWNMNTTILTMIKNDPRYNEPVEVIVEKTGAEKLVGTFLFTGTLSKKRSEWEKIVVENGGKIASSVSKNLNYLVVGDGGGSKQDKAEALGTVKIIDETTFLAMLG
jgi:DNA ligase (NAD+)